MADTTTNRDVVDLLGRTQAATKQDEIPERYKGLTEKELLARKASEDFADIELQFEMAPYFGYTSPIDASAVKVHPEPRDRVDYDPYLRGWHIPKSAAPKIEKLKERGITELDGYPAEAGTVNVVLPHGEHKYFFPTSINEGTRQTLAHEFRHKRVHETPGRSSLKYQIGENEVRFLDVLTAQNEREYNAARRSYESTPLGIGVTPGNVRHKLESRTNFYKDLQKALNVDASGRMADGAYSPVVEYFRDEMAQDIREKNDPSNYAFFGSRDVNDPLAQFFPPKDNVFRYINKRLSQGYYAKMNKALKEERQGAPREVAEPPFEVKINLVDLPQNKANGGEVEYEYGVRPEAGSEVFDFILPYRREIITPSEEKVYMSDDPDAPVVYETIPGEYGEPELSFPFPVQAAIEGAPKVYDALRNWKGVLRSQEDRDKVRRAASAIQQGVGGFAKYIGAAGRAAQAQQEYAYDPELGLIDSSDFTLAVSTPLAPGLLPQKVSPSVLNMMAGPNAKGQIKDRIADAEKKLKRGMSNDEVYKKTGAVRLVENKLGAPIPIENFKINEEKLSKKMKAAARRYNLEAAQDSATQPRSPDFHIGKWGNAEEFIDWPEGFEAYPELKKLKVAAINESVETGPIFTQYKQRDKDLSRDSTVRLMGDTIYIDQHPRSEYIPFDLSKQILSAFQAHISEKEGFIPPSAPQAPDEALIAAARKRVGLERTVEDRLSGDSETSPVISRSELGKLTEAEFDERSILGTIPDIAYRRDPVGQLGYRVGNLLRAESPDDIEKQKKTFEEELIKAYAEPDKYGRLPLNFGKLMGVAPSNENIGAYETPVLLALRGMKDQKQDLASLINQTKKAAQKKGIRGITEQSLIPITRAFEQQGKVTPSDVIAYLEKRAVPIREVIRSGPTVKYNQPDSGYVTQALQPSGQPDIDKNVLLNPPENMNLVLLTTDTDPITELVYKNTTHYGDMADNIFAHMRYNNRKLVDEFNNILDAHHVEEFQSDWHQDARKRQTEMIQDALLKGKIMTATKAGSIIARREAARNLHPSTVFTNSDTNYSDFIERVRLNLEIAAEFEKVYGQKPGLSIATPILRRFSKKAKDNAQRYAEASNKEKAEMLEDFKEEYRKKVNKDSLIKMQRVLRGEQETNDRDQLKLFNAVVDKFKPGQIKTTIKNQPDASQKDLEDRESLRLFKESFPEISTLFKEAAYRADNPDWFNPIDGWAGKYLRDSVARRMQDDRALPDAPFKDNWMEVSFDRMLQQASANDKDGMSFTTDAIQEIRYPGVTFNYYDTAVKSYAQKIAKKYGVKLTQAEIPQRNMETYEQTRGHQVWYLPLTEKMKDDFTQKPLPYSLGGGVSSLASVARDMNHRPRGMASLAQIARNMHSGAVA